MGGMNPALGVRLQGDEICEAKSVRGGWVGGGGGGVGQQEIY